MPLSINNYIHLRSMQMCTLYLNKSTKSSCLDRLRLHFFALTRIATYQNYLYDFTFSRKPTETPLFNLFNNSLSESREDLLVTGVSLYISTGVPTPRSFKLWKISRRGTKKERLFIASVHTIAIKIMSLVQITRSAEFSLFYPPPKSAKQL